MTFRIDFSNKYVKFINSNDINEDEVIEDVLKVIEKFKGRKVNIDLKKMHGKWKGFFRLRLGKKRIL